LSFEKWPHVLCVRAFGSVRLDYRLVLVNLFLVGLHCDDT
jgi:hypothetical protein